MIELFCTTLGLTFVKIEKKIKISLFFKKKLQLEKKTMKKKF